jgi:uncharacterized membrane protein YsdA (DUF1294 family)/cold shock CspA family protein
VRTKGKISTWDDEKGYGFVEPLGGGPRVFIHISAFANRARRPIVDDVVTYALGKDGSGRTRAENATLAGDKLRTKARRGYSGLAGLVSAAFLALAAISVPMTNLPVLVPAAYVILSIFTFVAYAIDKSAAQKGRWRTSEATLHVLALAGGWPGALIARQTLRHKSRKASFRVAFWATVVLNCAVFAWLHTSEGRLQLDRLLPEGPDLAIPFLD